MGAGTPSDGDDVEEHGPDEVVDRHAEVVEPVADRIVRIAGRREDSHRQARNDQIGWSVEGDAWGHDTRRERRVVHGTTATTEAHVLHRIWAHIRHDDGGLLDEATDGGGRDHATRAFEVADDPRVADGRHLAPGVVEQSAIGVTPGRLLATSLAG
jgi:hypothetical protein